MATTSARMRSNATIDSEYTASGRMKNALVADLVKEAGTDKLRVDRLLRQRMGPHEWTENLARQLGVTDEDDAWTLHDTLMVLVPELDRLLKNWPLPESHETCTLWARSATRSLGPVELVATLEAGPPSWRHGSIEGCRLDNLAAHLQPALERGLATSLASLLGRWNEWEVHKLVDAWRDAQARERDAERKAAEERVAEQQRLAELRKTKRIPPPPKRPPAKPADLEAARRRQGFMTPTKRWD